jgi:hypothetical protein
MAAKKPKAITNDNGAASPAALLTERTAITFAGRKYNLIMTNGALIEFEQITGISSLMEPQKIYDKPSLHSTCAMLYVLIKRDGSTLTHDQVVSLIKQRQVPDIHRAILAARGVAYMKEEQQDPSNPTLSLAQ